jgi:hypothetical protein
MKKIVGYILIGITLLLYSLWLGTDVLEGSTYRSFLPIILIVFPVIGYKMLQRAKKDEKIQN